MSAAALSSTELKVERKEAEERTSRREWLGPTVFVKIHADLTTVITSTDVIGKDEFAESLFRKRLEELMEVRVADESTATPMLEMRFDRSGKTLQFVVDAMRGYPMDDVLPASHCKMFLADCEFYQLHSLLPKFARSAPETRAAVWDPTRIDSVTHSIVESLLVRNGANGTWKCNGLTEVLRSGDHKWVEFKIRKSVSGGIMFGVAELNNFSTQGSFGQIMGGVGYNATNGFLQFPRKGKKTCKMFAGPSGVGDNIRIAVRIALSGKSALMNVSKNGTEIGSEELSQHFAVNGGLVFAVCTRNSEDEVKIVGSGK